MFSVEESYERHSEQLYTFIYLLTLNETLAEDLLQETFLRAFKACYTYRKDANELTWLRKIAKNTVLDHAKSKKKYFWQTYDELTDKSAFSPSPEELTAMNEQTVLLYEAIATLKLEYRLAIVLRKIEGLSIQETARTLDWNESKVKNATERGMKALEAILKGGALDGEAIITAQSTYSHHR